MLAPIASASLAAAQVPVTTCGQTVDDGVLVADLDCSASSENYAVYVEPGGSVDLAGFTLTSAINGIACLGKCEIFSDAADGTIVGGDSMIAASGRLYVHDLVLHAGSIQTQATGRLERVVIENGAPNATNATLVYAKIGLQIRDSIIRDSFGRIRCGWSGPDYKYTGRVRLKDVLIERGASDAEEEPILSGTVLKVVDSAFADNVGWLLAATRLTLRNSTITGTNGARGIGVSTSGISRLVDSTITGSSKFGISSHAATLIRSDVTANGLGPACGVTEPCADIATFERPSLNSSSCDRSYVLGPNEIPQGGAVSGVDWDACAAD